MVLLLHNNQLLTNKTKLRMHLKYLKVVLLLRLSGTQILNAGMNLQVCNFFKQVAFKHNVCILYAPVSINPEILTRIYLQFFRDCFGKFSILINRKLWCFFTQFGFSLEKIALLGKCCFSLNIKKLCQRMYIKFTFVQNNYL